MFARKGTAHKGVGRVQVDSYGDKIRVYNRQRQTGTSRTRIDRKLKALHPGKRIPKSGEPYYEYRRNRSDRDRQERL